jgi:DNA-binding NtrC family response regulator
VTGDDAAIMELAAQRVSSPVLVGRAAEAAQLGAAFDRAAAGQATVVVVAGEAGVGKTRLVAELADRVRRQGALALAPAAAVPGRAGARRPHRAARAGPAGPP